MFDRFKNYVWAGVALGALATSLPAAAQEVDGNERQERHQRAERAPSPEQDTARAAARAEARAEQRWSRPEQARPAEQARPSQWNRRDAPPAAQDRPAWSGRERAAPATPQVSGRTDGSVGAGGYVSAPRDRSYGGYTRGNRGGAVRGDGQPVTGGWTRGDADRRQPDAQAQDRSAHRGDWNRDWDRSRRDDRWRENRRDDSWRAERRDDARNYSRGYRDGYRADNRYGSNHRHWDRNRWRSDNRYDWYRYRAANRSIFSLGRYYAPYRNYSYNRISIGFRLGSLFYSNRYWIADPWRYRLPDVYGPYRWVRYYDDALLVDVYSGEVVDVIYDFFW